MVHQENYEFYQLNFELFVFFLFIQESAKGDQLTLLIYHATSCIPFELFVPFKKVLGCSGIYEHFCST